MRCTVVGPQYRLAEPSTHLSNHFLESGPHTHVFFYTTLTFRQPLYKMPLLPAKECSDKR
uniref:Uncharacterized protein n=1 Tax=Parascaris equorum TaxID=6256 RepID=A0A914RR00_PAREQ